MELHDDTPIRFCDIKYTTECQTTHTPSEKDENKKKSHETITNYQQNSDKTHGHHLSDKDI